MQRSRAATLGLAALALVLAIAAATACSSPTSGPSEGTGTSEAPSGDFGAPPGPANVPSGGQAGAYPDSSIDNYPTVSDPYPEPGEDAAVTTSADEAGTEEVSETVEPAPTESGTEEAAADATPTSKATPTS